MKQKANSGALAITIARWVFALGYAGRRDRPGMVTNRWRC